jgi:hypothetical protein
MMVASWFYLTKDYTSFACRVNRFLESGQACPTTAAGKGEALEIGKQCYLGDEDQISLQAWPARP